MRTEFLKTFREIPMGNRLTIGASAFAVAFAIGAALMNNDEETSPSDDAVPVTMPVDVVKAAPVPEPEAEPQVEEGPSLSDLANAAPIEKPELVMPEKAPEYFTAMPVPEVDLADIGSSDDQGRWDYAGMMVENFSEGIEPPQMEAMKLVKLVDFYLKETGYMFANGFEGFEHSDALANAAYLLVLIDRDAASPTHRQHVAYVQAAYDLGYHLLHGKGVAQNYAAAYALFEFADKNGHALAEDKIDYMLGHGLVPAESERVRAEDVITGLWTAWMHEGQMAQYLDIDKAERFLVSAINDNRTRQAVVNALGQNDGRPAHIVLAL